MSKVFTKRDLIVSVSKETNLSQSQIRQIFTTTSKIQMEKLKADYVVKTQNGQIKIVTKKAKYGTNPQNGKKILIPSSKKPKFIFSKEFKENFK